MKNIQILFLAGLSIIASACGNVNTPAENLTATSAGLTQNNSVSNLEAAQRCSVNENIQSNLGASVENYRACAYGNQIGQIALYPTDLNTKTVCVFPVRVMGSSSYAVVANANNPVATRFVYQCYNVKNSGSVISFAGLSFNAIYTVSLSNLSIMADCLNSGSPAACAAQRGLPMSFGQFAN